MGTAVFLHDTPALYVRNADLILEVTDVGGCIVVILLFERTFRTYVMPTIEASLEPRVL